MMIKVVPMIYGKGKSFIEILYFLTGLVINFYPEELEGGSFHFF